MTWYAAVCDMLGWQANDVPLGHLRAVNRIDAGDDSCLQAAVALHWAGLPGGCVPVVLGRQAHSSRALHAAGCARGPAALQGCVAVVGEDGSTTDP